MKKADVVVIGGSAAGIVAATTGRSFYPDKSFMVIRKELRVLVPCGIPYMFGTLEAAEHNYIPDTPLEEAGIELTIADVSKIDAQGKRCHLGDGTEVAFDKLIIATGSTPVRPGWLAGADLENVFTIPKRRREVLAVREALEPCGRIVVVGGGFIGIEIADELCKRGKDVTVVELMPQILSLAFDPELTSRAEEVLRARGVGIRTGHGVKRILGTGSVTGVLLDDGEELDADAVVLSVGYRPNSRLAAEAGLKVDERGFIETNEYMQTDQADIFAIGDCAAKRGFLTRTPKGTMLASISSAEARIAGMNLYGLSRVRAFCGTISIFCTAIGEHAFGAAGLTENLANERGFEVVTGLFEGVDHHPGTLPGTHKQIVKLIVSREGGLVLGGEVIGGPSTGELINLIGFAIQNQATVNSLLTAQIGTHPLLTGPPTAYPLIKVAEIVEKKRRKLAC